MIELVRNSRSILLLLAALAVLSLPYAALGQTDAKPATSAPADASRDLPKYDVATIKPTAESNGMMRFMFTPAGISLTGVPIQMLLTEGFHVEDDHILGAPEWAKNKRWDVEAKVSPEDAPKLDKLQFDERRSMLLPLLVERFNLKYHHETREMASYSLVVAKGGPKMKPSEVQPPPPEAKPPEAKPGEPAPSRPQQRRMLRFAGRGNLEAEASDTHMLARVLSQQLGRTVIDNTGLTASYDYTLHWTPDDAPPPMPGGPDAGGTPHPDNGGDAIGPSLFTAVQEQLGLKLESTKGMADVVVIDHIDLPSDN
jgi:bla regulator protein blaR1